MATLKEKMLEFEALPYDVQQERMKRLTSMQQMVFASNSCHYVTDNLKDTFPGVAIEGEGIMTKLLAKDDV